MEAISFSDEPAEVDELNSQQIYEGLAELIRKAALPFVLAIVGEWGSGKTTLINHSLERLQEYYQITTFNAWSHSKGTPLLKGLFAHLATEKGDTWDKLKDNLMKLVKSPIASAAVRGVGSFGGPIGTAIGETVVQYLRKPEDGKQKGNENDNVEALIQDFKEIATIFESQKKPLLIFIDDLDRCTPPEALDLVDDVKVYLTIDAPVIFIAAIDRRTLSMGIKAKYGAESEISVDDYLQKIFSYVVHMPEFTQLDTLVENAISSVGARESEIDLAEIAKHLIELCGLKNIRSIKRILRRWAFLVPSRENRIRAAGLGGIQHMDIKTNLENLSRFMLLLCTLLELYPEHYEALRTYKISQQHLAKQLEIASGAATDQFYTYYLQGSGFEGNREEEVERMKNQEISLQTIYAGLVAASFLKKPDAKPSIDVGEGYRLVLPIILDAVWLGLPLVK